MTGVLTVFEYMWEGMVLAVDYWWLWLPFILALAAYVEWTSLQRATYLAGIKWMVLEVIPPPTVPWSSPKAAESVFSGLHASYGGGTGWKPQFFTGKVPDWFSFEIVSHGGETHFYVRCPEGQRNVIESLIFAQYPEAEIRVVPDYIDAIPEKPDLAQYDVSGTEFEFAKESAYPIKTFPEFEEAGGKDEYARIDPIAPLVEIMSALQPGENLWIQYVLRPTGGDWTKEHQKVVDKLKGKKEEVKPLPFSGLFSAIDKLAGVVPPEKKEEKKDEFNLQKLTAAERKVLEQVEYKMAKLAFKVGIRILYVAPKDRFNGSRMASVSAMFKQLYYTNLNSFKPGFSTRDKGILPWLFPNDKGFLADERMAKKKHGVIGAYRSRAFPEKLPILTTEELATIWHLPGLNVKAPLLPRVQAKKGQPPAILPTRP